MLNQVVLQSQPWPRWHLKNSLTIAPAVHSNYKAQVIKTRKRKTREKAAKSVNRKSKTKSCVISRMSKH